ncbi:transposase [candidate division WOR-3 bacterium]|nr:transposase [candidate division WOR-3 bacterium]
MVENVWLEIPQIFSDTKLHEYIIMPNHFHAIIEIVGADSISAHNTDSTSAHNADSISAPTGNGRVVRTDMEYGRANMEFAHTRAEMDSLRAEMDSAPTGTDVSLPKIVQTFKRYTTIEYIKMVKQNILPPFEKRIWQRNYYEHIIRDEKSYRNIAEYIINNPLKWKEDDYYVQID